MRRILLSLALLALTLARSVHAGEPTPGTDRLRLLAAEIATTPVAARISWTVRHAELRAERVALHLPANDILMPELTMGPLAPGPGAFNAAWIAAGPSMRPVDARQDVVAR